MASQVVPTPGPVPVLAPPHSMSVTVIPAQHLSRPTPEEACQATAEPLEVADVSAVNAKQREEVHDVASDAPPALSTTQLLPSTQPPVRELLAKQSFCGVFEGLRPAASHTSKQPTTLAIFRVVESLAYERPGLCGDKEYLVGCEFALPLESVNPSIQQIVHTLPLASGVRITWCHSCIGSDEDRVPERLVTDLRVEAVPTAHGRMLDPEHAALAVMRLADHHARNGRLTVTETQTFLKGTPHEDFMYWLTDMKQWHTFDRTGSGTIELSELRSALRAYYANGGRLTPTRPFRDTRSLSPLRRLQNSNSYRRQDESPNRRQTMPVISDRSASSHAQFRQSPRKTQYGVSDAMELGNGCITGRTEPATSRTARLAEPSARTEDAYPMSPRNLQLEDLAAAGSKILGDQAPHQRPPNDGVQNQLRQRWQQEYDELLAAKSREIEVLQRRTEEKMAKLGEVRRAATSRGARQKALPSVQNNESFMISTDGAEGNLTQREEELTNAAVTWDAINEAVEQPPQESGRDSRKSVTEATASPLSPAQALSSASSNGHMSHRQTLPADFQFSSSQNYQDERRATATFGSSQGDTFNWSSRQVQEHQQLARAAAEAFISARRATEEQQKEAQAVPRDAAPNDGTAGSSRQMRRTSPGRRGTSPAAMERRSVTRDRNLSPNSGHVPPWKPVAQIGPAPDSGSNTRRSL